MPIVSPVGESPAIVAAMLVTPSWAFARAAALVSVAAVAFPNTVAAQVVSSPDGEPTVEPVEVIGTDRPGFWCGPYVVGTGVFQIETGAAFDWSRQGDRRSSGLGTPLVMRYGVADRVEMRLKTSGLVIARESGAGIPRSSTEGIAAPTVEAKWQLTESEGPTIAVLISTALPIGSPALRPGELQPAALISADLPVSGSASVALNAGVVSAFDEASEDRFAQGFFAAVLGFALTDNRGAFVEVATTTPDTSHGESVVLVDGGVSWVVSPDLQLDLSAIRGVTDNATDWTAMVGISLRFR